MESQPITGLFLNAHKCEITARNVDIINKFPIFIQCKRVLLEDMTLLGAPILAGRAVDAALKEKTAILEKSIKHLSLLPSHDALSLLKNSIGMPKMLYILRTSSCAGNPHLQEFGNVLRSGLETILNVQLPNVQWKQASSPVDMGGLGVRGAGSLTPSAFLASAWPRLHSKNKYSSLHSEILKTLM